WSLAAPSRGPCHLPGTLPPSVRKRKARAYFRLSEGLRGGAVRAMLSAGPNYRHGATMTYPHPVHAHLVRVAALVGELTAVLSEGSAIFDPGDRDELAPGLECLGNSLEALAEQLSFAADPERLLAAGRGLAALHPPSRPVG